MDSTPDTKSNLLDIPPPTDPITDIRSLLPELKALLSTATNAKDDAILEIWLQLCRTMAFFGPSVDRFSQTPIGAALRTVASAAETVVVITHRSDGLARDETDEQPKMSRQGI